MTSAPKKPRNPDFFSDFDQNSSSTPTTPKPTFQAYQPDNALDQLTVPSDKKTDLENQPTSTKPTLAIDSPDDLQLEASDELKLPPPEQFQLPSSETLKLDQSDELSLPQPDELRLPATTKTHQIPIWTIIFILASLMIASFFAINTLRLRNQVKQLQQVTQEQSTQPATTKTKDYSNTQFNLDLFFPDTVTFEVVSIPDSNKIELLFNKDKPGQFSINANINYTPEEAAYLLDTASTSRQVIAGNLWDVYSIPKYQESPDHTPVDIFALRLEKHDILYTLIFLNQTDTTDQQDQIINTLTFVTPPSSSSATLSE